MKRIKLLALATALSLSACQAPETNTKTKSVTISETAMVTDAVLANAENTPAEWLTYGGNYLMNGALKDNGMVSFKEQITMEQAEMIRAYILDQAHLAMANGE